MTSPIKLGIIATHPIQYQVPWFKELARCDALALKVYYALIPSPEQQGTGFGVAFTWDLPLMEGYEWELLANTRPSPKLGTFFGLSTPGIYQALRRDQLDAMIVTGWNSLPLMQTLWACVRLRIPRIMRAETNSLRTKRLPVRIAHRALLSWFDACLAIGTSNREFYLTNGVDPERVHISRYFVDNERFERQLAEIGRQRKAIRSEWNVPPGRTCFLYAGKLTSGKGILDLLKALDLARRGLPGIHLLVAGSGELQSEAEQISRNLNLPVTFTGFMNQTEISGAYAAADCLVLPSHAETWGLVVNEAMASGLPVIVSDRVGCGPDLVEDGITGLTFPCGDIAALAASLTGAASSLERLKTMGEQARLRIKNYSAHNAASDTVAALKSILGKRTRASSRIVNTTTP